MSGRQFAQQIILFSGLLISHHASAQWFTYQQAIMGTSIVVELFSDTAKQAEQCSEQVFTEMQRINALMSPTIKVR